MDDALWSKMCSHIIRKFRLCQRRATQTTKRPKIDQYIYTILVLFKEYLKKILLNKNVNCRFLFSFN